MEFMSAQIEVENKEQTTETRRKDNREFLLTAEQCKYFVNMLKEFALFKRNVEIFIAPPVQLLWDGRTKCVNQLKIRKCFAI